MADLGGQAKIIATGGEWAARFRTLTVSGRRF
jgi:hypothetical protein